MQLTRAQLLQFLSAESAEAVAASEEDLLVGSRLEVSVLCCDVAAFRPLAEAAPESALDALNRLLPALATVILAQGGTLMSFPGDGVLAVFGAPVADREHRAHADAAEAEVAGPALAAVNGELESLGREPLAIRTAVRSGPVVAGVIGAEPRWEYAAIGEPTSAAVAAASG